MWKLCSWFFLFLLIGCAVDAELEDLLKNLNERLKLLNSQLNKAYETRDRIAARAVKTELQNFRRNAKEMVTRFRDENIESDYVKRQFELFANIGRDVIPREMNCSLEQIKSTVYNVSETHMKTFEIWLFSRVTDSLKNDYSVEHHWSLSSRLFANAAVEYIDRYFDYWAKMSVHLGFSSPFELWMYALNYDQYPDKDEIIHIWNSELKESYRQLMSQLKKDFNNTFTLSTSSTPAYFFDLLYISSHEGFCPIYKNSSLYQKLKESVLYIEDIPGKVILEKAVTFFESLGFRKLNDLFWNKTIFKIERKSMPRGEIQYNSKEDYSFFMKGPANSYSFAALHRMLIMLHGNLLRDEIGLPEIFKERNFDLFHEAFETAVMKSAKSLRRSVEEGFLPPSEVTEELKYEMLKEEAIKVFTNLASGMSLGSWLWDVHAGNIPADEKIKELWNRRLEYEGVVPVTTDRLSIENAHTLDVLSSNHLLADAVNFNIVLELILHFQILARLCEVAGEFNPENPLEKPLNECNIKGSIAAGNLIKDVLRYGYSKNWRELLDVVTGQVGSRLNAKGLLDYFAPVFSQMRLISFTTFECKWRFC